MCLFTTRSIGNYCAAILFFFILPIYPVHAQQISKSNIDTAIINLTDLFNFTY